MTIRKRKTLITVFAILCALCVGLFSAFTITKALDLQFGNTNGMVFQSGASIRVDIVENEDNDNTGIRFRVYIKESLYTELTSNLSFGSTSTLTRPSQLGMIIVPTPILETWNTYKATNPEADLITYLLEQKNSNGENKTLADIATHLVRAS